MKKNTVIILAACFVILSFCTQCKKAEPAAFSFFTRTDTVQTKLNLYIDGSYVAPLPYIQLTSPDEKIVPDWDTIKLNNAIIKMVDGGRHTFSAKDANGLVKSEIDIKVLRNGYTIKMVAGKYQTYHAPTIDGAMPIDFYY